MDNVVEINNLCYESVFHDFNLEIKKADYIVVAGTNKSGKTTLLKIISGLISTKESVKYNGVYIESINKNTIFSDIFFISCIENIIFNYETVEEELFAILDNVAGEDKIRLFQEVIGLLAIDDILADNPNDLSRYNKIKLLLAAAYFSQPSIILIDDLGYFLTRDENEELLNILNILNQDNKITIIFSTSNLENAIYANYIYILDEGKIVLQGKSSDVLKEDNKISKIGLNIPFMYDLSVKLVDYDLIDDVILDRERLVDTLWK